MSARTTFIFTAIPAIGRVMILSFSYALIFNQSDAPTVLYFLAQIIWPTRPASKGLMPLHILITSPPPPLVLYLGHGSITFPLTDHFVGEVEFCLLCVTFDSLVIRSCLLELMRLSWCAPSCLLFSERWDHLQFPLISFGFSRLAWGASFADLFGYQTSLTEPSEPLDGSVRV